MTTLKLRFGSREHEVTDCKSCQLQNFAPRCLRGLDMAKCATCEQREPRNGDYHHPPLVMVSLPHAASELPKPSTPQPAPQPERMRGLGDAVAKVTKTLGIKECGGCKKRREALNKMVPFGTKDEPKPEG